MSNIGTILRVERHREYYEISTTSGKPIVLFLDECGEQKFRQGDIVSYETMHSDEFGVCASNPIKKGNQFLEKLNECLETKEPIKAYVYAKNKTGYEVSYNGIRCFLPFNQCSYRGLIKDAELLKTLKYFTVVAMFNENVILSRRETLEKELAKLQCEEMKTIEPGFQFLGEVTGVKRFGLFIKNKFTDGLLYVSKIVEGYDEEMSNETKNEIGEWLEVLFPIGEKLLVSIEDMSEGQITLDWDKSVEPNKTKIEQLRRFGM